MVDKDRLTSISLDVLEEFTKATKKHGAFNSAHEGYAVILEEMDELWDEVKKNGSTKRMKEEAIQIAAMAMRFLHDVCDDQYHNPDKCHHGFLNCNSCGY